MGPVVGVDLGATNIRGAITHPDGGIGPLVARKVPASRAPEAIAQAVADVARDATSGPAPSSVGVGLAGWLDSDRGIVLNGPNLGFRHVPFARLLEDRLPDSRVVLTNDLRAIAWGEYLHGAGSDAQVLLVIFMGSGIGSSVVIDGNPLSGASNVACEIGHIRVVPFGGRACGCGQVGCLEAYVGGHNLAKRAGHDVSIGVETSLREHHGGISPDDIEKAAQQGDAYARKLWSEAAGYTGQVIGSLLTYLNPDRVIMGGGLWGAAMLRALVVEAIETHASPAALSACSFVAPELGDGAGIVGAGAFARL